MNRLSSRLHIPTLIRGGGGDSPVKLVAVTALAAFVLWLISQVIKKSLRTLPPGPKGLPLIGDVQHIADDKWLMSPERRREYGEMMYISALGQGLLVLNSQRVAIDLFEKRSTIYSDRPRYISGGDFLTEGLTFTFSAYGSLWRRFRRASMESFSKSVVPRFYPIQSREALTLALALLRSPSALESHLQRHASSIMLSINYHLPPTQSEEDPIVVRAANHARRVLHEIQPGVRLVEYFPWLRYVPSKFAKWKRDARHWFVEDSLWFERLFNKVTNDIANGIDQPSFTATLIKNRSKYNLSARELAWLAGDMLIAGGETTSSTLEWWILALLSNPAAQTKAHAELDEVIGRGRPPETLRWSPLLPLGVPHVSTADDWYEGAFIPKGTICLANMRVLNFETGVYGEDAARFNPDRFFDKGEKGIAIEGREEGHLTFGFGRRLCVGRHIAEGTLAIDFATVLWAMRFERPPGARGELDLHTLVRTGVTTRPAEYEFKAIPRFPEAETYLSEALELY
ncbi:cytochrome P450 [Russula brevipes]|nr:cytochrome P450 [Russula brevipes]